MKIYTQTYDLAKASPHRFWVAPFSEFKIGIKILEKDQISDKNFTVKTGSIELTPDKDKIDNFTLYTIKSNDTGFVEYTIEVEGVAEKLKLMQIVTDSTVFEIDASGGDVPADVATQTWVNSQISDFVDEDALTAYATKDQLTGYVENSDLTAYAEKTDLTAYAEKTDLTAYATKDQLTSYVENSELTSYYTKSETSSATQLAGQFNTVSQSVDSAYNLASEANEQVSHKVDYISSSSAPEVRFITTYYESEYSQLTASDPSWLPDDNTMYVIIPDKK